MKKYFLTILILTACAAEPEQKPQNLMPQDQMAAFLIDVHLAEGQLQAMKIHSDSSVIIFRDIEQALYQKYGIDSTKFLNSYHYYLHHVELLSDIYDVVIDSLSLREKVLINSGR